MDEAASDSVLDIAAAFGVRRVNLTMSMKRTIKTGDDFQSFESGASWTLEHPTLTVVSPDVAKAVGHLYAPILIRKIVTDLHIGGVVSKEEAVYEIAKAERLYKQLLDGKKVGREADHRDTGGHPSDLHGDGDPQGPRPPEPPTGV